MKEILLTIKRDFTYKYSTLEKNFVKGMKLVGKGCGLRAKEIVSARPVPNQASSVLAATPLPLSRRALVQIQSLGKADSPSAPLTNHSPY